MTHTSQMISVSLVSAAVLIGCGSPAAAQQHEAKKMSEADIVACQKKFHIDPKGDKPMQQVQIPPTHQCSSTIVKNGFLMPDPTCTPGAVNPTLKLTTLRQDGHGFSTECVRNQATREGSERPVGGSGSEALTKKDTYGWYAIQEPADNEHANQTCELDHLISLELGGADTLDNLWPQCGPPGVALDDRYFKQKDTVENYLAWQVRNGKMKLADAQKGIATDWTQYVAKAKAACPNGTCPKATASNR